MKICKIIIGAFSVILGVVGIALYFATKADPTSELAVATFYAKDVSQVNSTAYTCMFIALIGTIAGGALSILFCNKRAGEGLMVGVFAVALFLALSHSLLFPYLLYVTIWDFIAILFTISYTQIDNDINGKIG